MPEPRLMPSVWTAVSSSVTVIEPVATAPPYWLVTRQLYSPVSCLVRLYNWSLVSSSGGGESLEDWRGRT